MPSLMSDTKKSKVLLRSVAGSSVGAAVRECMEQFGWENWVERDATVVIKPNLSTALLEKVEASNTDVAVTEAVCQVLLERTKRISIGESGHLRQSPWQAFPASGYVEMARRLGVELVNFSESATVRVACEPAGEIKMPRLLVEAEVYINLPKLKTHALTYFTGALKNQWGCVPDCLDRLRLHRVIDHMLCSLQGLLRPRFVLMDGIVGMEGRGPVNGRPRRLDAILASLDPVALDATAMRLVGLDPSRARHVVLAAEKGLGRMRTDQIEIDGEWERLATEFMPAPRDFANMAMFYASQYRWFVKHILANDRIYYPVRDLVQFLRKFGMVAR